MRFEFVLGEKANFPVAVLCRHLGVSRSGYYSWLRRKPSARAARREQRAREVKVVHEQSRGVYGSPRVCAEMRAKGEIISENTVAKLMRAEDIAARRRRRRHLNTTDSRHTKRIAPNLLERDFTAAAPNEVWVTDVTAVSTYVGWCFLAAIIDLFSRRVVGWAVGDHNDTKLALAALGRATISRRHPRGLIHHSDRGSPYGSDEYIAELDAHSMRRSMSRKGDCWDNAVAESFFSTFDHECRRHHDFTDSDHAREEIAAYIDGFYNPVRRHSTLGYASPITHELEAEITALAV